MGDEANGLHACIYYQEYVATIKTMSEASKRIKVIHALLFMQLGMVICYQYESSNFSTPYVDNQPLRPEV